MVERKFKNPNSGGDLSLQYRRWGGCPTAGLDGNWGVTIALFSPTARVCLLVSTGV